MSKQKPKPKAQKPKSPPDPPRDTPIVQAEPDRQKKTDQSEAEAKPTRWYAKLAKIKPEWVTAVFAGIAAFATAIYAIVSYGQWEAMKDATKVSNRPYVVVKDAKAIGITISSKIENPVLMEKRLLKLTLLRPMLSLSFNNFGNTPALNVRFVAFIGLNAKFIEDDVVYDVTNKIGPEQISTMGKDVPVFVNGAPSHDITEEVLEDLATTKLRLTIFGYATYDNVFDEHQRTRFCYYFAPEMNDMTACPHHNDMK